MLVIDVLNNNETKPFSWKLIVEVCMKETDLVSSDENGDGELDIHQTIWRVTTWRRNEAHDDADTSGA